MENKLQEINSKLNDTEEWVSDLEDKTGAITQSEQQKKNKTKQTNKTLKIRLV